MSSSKSISEQRPPPSAGAIPVTVNGIKVNVPRLSPHPITGVMIPTTMIQACEQAGVAVPHYCYHPKLPVAGNCRMCLVEFGTPILGPDRQPLVNPDGSPQIRKSPRPAIACATPISTGMEIYTDTPSVREMRRGVLEFLLINHPLDCPICDQAGECKLQEYSIDHGQTHSQFVEYKVHKPKQVELGPRIMLDDERCILCARCIRFTRDIAGDDALGFVNRGSHSTLTHYPGRPFDNNYTLNTVDICPVGALTSKDFRFQMRVWFLKETPSVCSSCARGCNITIGSRQNVIYRLTPRDNEDVNQCWMCDHGRLNYKWIGRADRLSKAQVRSADGSLCNVEWTEALSRVIERLRGAKPGSVALIASARQTAEELYLLSRLARHLGALTDSVPRLGEADRLLVHADKNPNSLGTQWLGLAAQPVGSRLASINKAIQQGEVRALLVWGEDVTPFISEEHLKHLETLIVTGILPNKTTALAHILLPGCAPVEKRGTFTNFQGRVQRLTQAIAAPGEARPESGVLLELLEALAGATLPVSIEGLFDLMASETPAYRGLSWGSLGMNGRLAPGKEDHARRD